MAITLFTILVIFIHFSSALSKQLVVGISIPFSSFPLALFFLYRHKVGVFLTPTIISKLERF